MSVAASKDLRATWISALKSLSLPLLFILAFRWALFEPYVIPSGSMIPNLLIHDYILVNKFAYGLRLPFTYRYLFSWAQPKRGEVVVFRNVGAEDYFLVKRVVGLPGDIVSYNSKGELMINHQSVTTSEPTEDERESFFSRIPLLEATTLSSQSNFLMENFLDSNSTLGLGARHFILSAKTPGNRLEQTEAIIPQGQYFMMGDNRDRSADSRVWGFLPFNHILGRASLIWFSCGENPEKPEEFCEPTRLRLMRILTRIN